MSNWQLWQLLVVGGSAHAHCVDSTTRTTQRLHFVHRRLNIVIITYEYMVIIMYSKRQTKHFSFHFIGNAITFIPRNPKTRTALIDERIETSTRCYRTWKSRVKIATLQQHYINWWGQEVGSIVTNIIVTTTAYINSRAYHPKSGKKNLQIVFIFFKNVM